MPNATNYGFFLLPAPALVGVLVDVPTPEKTFEEGKKRGWGLQIIRSLMDSVAITSGDWGTRILMRKYK